MRIGVVGINHKLASVKLREALAKGCQNLFGLNNPFSSELCFVLLSTCNRTEIYFSSEDLAWSHQQLLSSLRQEISEDFEQKLYSFFGQDCFLHLAKVTAGLDSAIIGETEIQGQVKTAYETTSKLFSLTPDLHFLFQKSLKIAKEIRSTLCLERDSPGLQHVSWAIAHSFFTKHTQPKVLFVGASDINHKMLRFFKTKGLKNIYLCNRSNHCAVEMAHKENISFIDWSQLKHWPCFDWIICATKSPQHLILAQDYLAAPHIVRKSKKLIIDLSVPRNVDPSLAHACPQVQLVNIDYLNQTLQERQRDIAHSAYVAEHKLESFVHKHTHLFLRKRERALQLATA